MLSAEDKGQESLTGLYFLGVVGPILPVFLFRFSATVCLLEFDSKSEILVCKIYHVVKFAMISSISYYFDWEIRKESVIICS